MGAADGSEGPRPEQFLPPGTGIVAGIRLRALVAAADLMLALRARVARQARRLDELDRGTPARKALAAAVYRPDSAWMEAAAAEIRRSRHDVRLVLGSTGAARPALAADTVAEGLAHGKFQNLNSLLEAAGGAGGADRLLIVDDDVQLPPRFLDRLLAVCERFELDLAQPALTRSSHTAWPVTRRRAGSLVRETRFVEIGPVTLFSSRAASELTPFPELRFGWGLDSHWSALAAQRGWRLGVVDAVPVRHSGRTTASSYSRGEAVDEARRFLAGRSWLPVERADDVVAIHR